MADAEARVPLPAPIDEGVRLVSAAGRQELTVRLLGGVAVRLQCTGPDEPLFERSYADIDLIAAANAGRAVGRFLESMGYEPDAQFNALNGHRRLLYRDDLQERSLDVFLGEFTMCHALPLSEHMERESFTVSLADLLLTKLQIVELNEKDRLDIFNLLHAREVVEGPSGDGIEADRIAHLCARDWGLWKTCTNNLRLAETAISSPELYDLVPSDRDLVIARLRRLAARIEVQPKTRRWALRGRVGERVRWYDTPEEVN